MVYTIIRGRAVSGADTYKLYKKQGNSYIYIGESSRLYFDLLALGVSNGDYAVKAFGTGYQESDYSNLVSYTRPTTVGVRLLTSDGYTLTDINGLLITIKEEK